MAYERKMKNVFRLFFLLLIACSMKFWRDCLATKVLDETEHDERDDDDEREHTNSE